MADEKVDPYIEDDDVKVEKDKAEDLKGKMPGKKHYISKSMVSDRVQERKRVYLVTFAAAAAAASYICMLFIAMPLSIHTIINIEEGCDVGTDTACFAPIERSQTQLTNTLTGLRVATFLMGSLVGTISDRYGRKPLLVGALLGYTVAGVLFLFGWQQQNVNFFMAGAIILGASSPVVPHGIAYISDVSLPNRLAINLGILEGFGYFFGLMCGALISLAIGALTTGVKENLDAYNKMFYASYASGAVLSLLSALLTALFLPESLHPDDRTTKLDWKKANPFGFLPLVTRNMYFFLIWLSGVFAWCSIGAQESTTGGWWLRRYAIADTIDFIIYVVILWVLSGIGAAICTKVYVTLGGLKFAIHISAILTIAIGIIFAVAPTAKLSYIVVALAFFASSILPTTLALIMGQVDSTEKGALAGAIRSSEALSKFIGIFVVGNTFASYIAAFTPDESCIPATYTPNVDETNTCECGVETCPDFVFSGTGQIIGQKFVPSECSLGQLSQKVNGKTSKFISFPPDVDKDIYPQLLIDLGVITRPDDCIGKGLQAGLGGLTTNLDRLWCVSKEVNPTFNQAIGCPGFSFGEIQPDLAFYLCDGFSAPNATVGCSAPLFSLFISNGGSNYTAYHTPESDFFSKYLPIFQRLIDPNNEEEICEDEFEKGEFNLCLEGPIADFPGLFPLMFMGLLGALGYLSFVTAECFFVSGDQEYWKHHEEQLVEEELGDTAIGA